jgi:hypothetical protein
MTTTTGNTRIHSPASRRSTGHVLLHDDLGRITLRRLRPWHRLLARCAAARLDRQLAAGASPETSALLACRARISRSAGPLAKLAGSLAALGPVPVQGVAMVSQLLADGTGPLYQEACGDDLGNIIEKITQALTV